MPEQTALPTASAADITQLYDAYALLPKPDPTAQNPTPVYPDPANTPAGALPAALEFDGAHGRIIAPLEAVPSAALLAHPTVCEATPNGVQTIKFEEQADANWRIYLQGENIHTGAHFALPKAEMEAILARDGVPLPGRPSDAELAALRAPQSAPPATEDASERVEAPPF